MPREVFIAVPLPHTRGVDSKLPGKPGKQGDIIGAPTARSSAGGCSRATQCCSAVLANKRPLGRGVFGIPHRTGTVLGPAFETVGVPFRRLASSAGHHPEERIDVLVSRRASIAVKV
jgi:hypothetical protein